MTTTQTRVTRVRLGGDLYHVEVPDGAIRIDRRTTFGNPFKAPQDYGLDEALRLYRGWLRDDPESLALATPYWRRRKHGQALVDHARLVIPQYRHVACWCDPPPEGQGRCHGDILLDVVHGMDLEDTQVAEGVHFGTFPHDAFAERMEARELYDLG